MAREPGATADAAKPVRAGLAAMAAPVKKALAARRRAAAAAAATEEPAAEKAPGTKPLARKRRRKAMAARAAKARVASPAKPPAAKAVPDTPIIQILPMAGPAQPRLRHKGGLAAFVIMVLLPILLVFGYLQLRAEDQYASTLGFTVRSEDAPSASDLLTGIGSALGGSGSKDADILYDFIRSQELVAAVDDQLDLRRIWSRHHGRDPVFSFRADGSIEDLVSYWRRMVRVSYESGTGLMELRVLAFDRDEAREIARAIHAASTAMINQLSATARDDAMRYAQQDLERALERLKTAREALTAFRLVNNIVDVSADIQGQMGLLNTLQAQLAEALISHDLLLGTVRDNDPRLDQARARIEVTRARIAEERAKLGSGGGESVSGSAGYATTVAEFERLNVDRQFAESTYLAALQAHDAARAEANRQTRYLATYIRPTLAETSEFPQHLLILGLTGLFAFLIWAIGSLVFYALRDRR